MDALAHKEIARGLFRESNDVLILFDPGDHRVVDINPAGLRMTGQPRKVVLSLRVWDLFGSESPDGLIELMDAYQRTGFFQAREGFWIRTEDGHQVPVVLSVTRIHTQPQPLGLAVARDASERRRAQETIDRFFRMAPDLFCISRPGGRLLKLNAAWQQALGYSIDEMLTRDPSEFIHPDDQAATWEVERALERGEISGFENRWRHHDGSERILSWRAVMDQGLIYAVARDVTATRRLEDLARRAGDLETAKEEAERASEAKSSFLASLSHEIRTPMTAVLGFTELLLGDEAVAAAPARVRDALHTIQQEGHHTLELINDLLDLSRIEAGRLRVVPAPCSPLHLAEEVVALLRPRAEARRLSLNVEDEPGLPTHIATDPLRLRQVLVNLVDNALKFTERGSVRVRLRSDQDKALGQVLRIEIIDTGVGIAPETRKHLFEPFYQAELGAVREFEGAGLGLAISSRLVSLLGGRIEVESDPGLGSTFRIVLPIEAIEPPHPKPALAQPPVVDQGPLNAHLLVVEDHEANRRVITLQLERFGATVESAADGAEALVRVQAARDAGRPFDLILMDMQMPVLDGYEACRRLRAEGFSRPIIALTAFAMAEDREECLHVGCDDHLSKPIPLSRLIELVRSLLARSTTSTENRLVSAPDRVLS